MSLNKTSTGFSDENTPAINNSKNNLVVRIDEDSDDNLKALFDSVLNPGDSTRPLQVPFRMRKLPNSFFNPPAVNIRPTTVSHSRANSADSAYDAGSQQNVSQTTASNFSGAQSTNLGAVNIAQTSSNTSPKKLEISHSRAHSSPASLQQSYSMSSNTIETEGNCPTGGIGASFPSRIIGINQTICGNVNAGLDNVSQCISNNAPTIQSFHMKQRSYDVVSPIQLQNELGALPPGWEQAKTNDGQIYYLNHTTKTTQWEDPRIQQKQQQQQRIIQQSINANVSIANSSKECVPLNENLGPLPDGWEQAFTESGDVYFINHINRTTSWNDPRIPDFLQKPLKVPKTEMNWIGVQLGKTQEFYKAKAEQQNTLNRQTDNLHMDPFLSGDNHARQESSDSGLSLSSNTFSVNAEFAQLDDSMDCISENGNITTMSGLDCPDNLVSSLQLEDNICNEIFNDVDNILNTSSNKTENLEWYKIN